MFRVGFPKQHRITPISLDTVEGLWASGPRVRPSPYCVLARESLRDPAARINAVSGEQLFAIFRWRSMGEVSFYTHPEKSFI